MKSFVALICLLVSQLEAGARLSEDFENRYIAYTPSGWIGVGDWTEFAGELGKGYVAPLPQRTVSHIYLGPVDFYLPGKAALWLWAGPLLMSMPLVGAAVVWFGRGVRYRPLRGVAGGFVGLYYGATVLFMGHIEFGTVGKSDVWAVLAGSPLSMIRLEAGALYWGVLGSIIASLTGKPQARLLLAFVILHYLAFALLAVPSGVATIQQLQSVGWILDLFPIWFLTWAVLLLVGEVYVWIRIVRGYRTDFAQPGDAPNDGPATPVENSGGSGGGRHR